MFNKTYNQLQQPVIALPTVTVVEKNPQNDQYLLLGCDGVFDVFMTSQLVQYTTNRFTVYKTVKEVALDLVDTSFARGRWILGRDLRDRNLSATPCTNFILRSLENKVQGQNMVLNANCPR